MTISVVSVVDVSGPEAEGRRIAKYEPSTETLWIYPQGLGRGPVLVMSKADWRRLNHEVMLAMSRAENHELFNAVEGNGDAL